MIESVAINIDKIRRHCKHLREYYIKTDLTQVDKFFDDLYSGKDLLEVEEKCHYELAQKSVNDFLVQGASYQPDREKIIIYVHPNAIEDIDTGKGLFKNQIKKEAKLAIAHEEIHRQQHQGEMWQNTKNKLVDPEEDYDGYLSQAFEIDAHAVGCAQYLIGKYPEKKILDNLSNGIVTGLDDALQSAADRYKEIGGKVWQKFLKEMYDYIIEPHKKTDKLELKSRLYKKLKNRK
jgi:hypothetical protein